MNKTHDMKKYQHEYYIKNIERLKAYKKAYHLAHRKIKPELTEEEKAEKERQKKEKRRIQQKKYGETHRKQLNDYCRNRYNTNEEFKKKRKAAHKKWYDTHRRVKTNENKEC